MIQKLVTKYKAENLDTQVYGWTDYLNNQDNIIDIIDKIDKIATFYTAQRQHIKQTKLL